METADSPTLLLLDLPQSALAGINLLSFTATPRFRGVKDLPAGFHFVFAAASTAYSERHGLWFHVPSVSSTSDRPPIFITRWSPATETLEAVTDEAEILHWRANLGSIWREGLTPYRQTASKASTPTATADDYETNDWPSLTSDLSPALLSRITNSSDDRHWQLTSASSAPPDIESIPGLTDVEAHDLGPGQELRLLPIDLKRTWRANATGRERTEAAQDRSWALEQLAATYCSGGRVEEVLGEMQFCFLMVLTLNNFSCLEQWKRVLALTLTCRGAVVARPGFFVCVLAALRLQLQHCKDAEGGLIDLADEGGSLLRSLLTRFRRGLEGLSGTGVQDVVDELDDLEDYLRAEHGWQLGGDFVRSGQLELEDGEQVTMETTAFDEEDETGEFAPQIVELTSEQARMLNLEKVQNLPTRLNKASLRDDHIDAVVGDSDGEDDDDASDEDGTNESDDVEDMGDIEEMDPRF